DPDPTRKIPSCEPLDLRQLIGPPGELRRAFLEEIAVYREMTVDDHGRPTRRAVIDWKRVAAKHRFEWNPDGPPRDAQQTRAFVQAIGEFLRHNPEQPFERAGRKGSWMTRSELLKLRDVTRERLRRISSGEAVADLVEELRQQPAL